MIGAKAVLADALGPRTAEGPGSNSYGNLSPAFPQGDTHSGEIHGEDRPSAFRESCGDFQGSWTIQAHSRRLAE